MLEFKTVYVVMIKHDVLQICETEKIANTYLALWKIRVKKRFVKKLRIEKMDYIYE